MTSFPIAARMYLLTAQEHAPKTLIALLSHYPASDPIWETCPQSDRFCLREIVAHLTDWEDIWHERVMHTLEASGAEPPVLLRPDIDQRAQEKQYGQADPVQCLTQFQEKRTALTAWLRSLPDAAWERLAVLDRMGEITPEGLAALVLGHDAYHLRQVAEWLAAKP